MTPKPIRQWRNAALVLALGCLAALPVAARPADQNLIGVTTPVDAPKLVTGIRRPAILLYSNSYVYGSNSGFGNDIKVGLTISDQNFTTPVFMYVYWVDRASGATRYFNLSTGWGTAALDLFGSADNPIAIQTPNLTDFRLFGSNGAFGPITGVPGGTGQYMIVVELRDLEGRPLARDNAMYNFVDSTVQVSGSINTTTWTANNAYVILSPSFVEDGQTLTVEPGTVIYGLQGANLGVRRGGRLMAEGNSMNPIRLTSSKERTERQQGDVGGLTINGRGLLNNGDPAPGGGFEQDGEGDSGKFGGNVRNDSSGSIKYFIVEYTGFRFTEEDELNGIAFQGTGSGTGCSYIQAMNGADDGIEWFGGSTSCDHIYSINNEDDHVDQTFGADGQLSNVCVVETRFPPGGVENGLGGEIDNYSTDPDATPRTIFKVENGLFAMNPQADQPGILLRRGAGSNLKNVFITGNAGATSKPSLELNGAETNALIGTAEMVFDNVVYNGNPPSPNPLAGVNPASGPFRGDINLIHPDLVPRTGSEPSCDSRSEQWTYNWWVNNDVCQNC